MDDKRDKFEELVFTEYYIKGICKNGESQLMTSNNNLYKDELLKRTDGSTLQEYEREEIDAMWFGWKLAMREIKV